MRNVILKTSRDKWKGREWAAEAEALMEAVSDQIEKEYAVSQPLAPLADRFVSLLKKAADDPTLTTFGAQAVFDAHGDWIECMPMIEKARSQGGSMPGAIEAIVHRLHWSVAEADLLNDKAILFAR